MKQDRSFSRNSASAIGFQQRNKLIMFKRQAVGGQIAHDDFVKVPKGA